MAKATEKNPYRARARGVNHVPPFLHARSSEVADGGARKCSTHYVKKRWQTVDICPRVY